MAASTHVPQFFLAKSETEVQLKIRKIQIRLGVKIGIMTLVYKQDEKVWVCWYTLPRGHSIITGM